MCHAIGEAVSMHRVSCSYFVSCKSAKHGAITARIIVQSLRVYYIRSSRESAMTSIPAMSPAIATWCSAYSSAVGKSSSKEI